MDIHALIALGAFASLILITIGLAALRSYSESELLEARLSQFAEAGQTIATVQEVEMSLPFTVRVVKPALDRIGEFMERFVKGSRFETIQEELNMAGRPGGLTVAGFLALRAFAVAAGAFLGFGLSVVLQLGAGMDFLLLVAMVLAGFLAPKMVVVQRIKRRQKELLLGLPSALDLLTICVEAGLTLDAAMTRVTEKYHNSLSNEFQQVLNEIRLGRPRSDALEEMGRRNKVPELNAVVQAIVQSEQLGVGIANVLRIQSDEMRRRRRQRAEEAGQKAPLKMLFPMVGCMFPTLFIVLLGPAFILVSKTFH